jgi:hypothetical protein
LFLLANLLLTSAISACPKLKMPVARFANPVFAEGRVNPSATAKRSLAQTRQSQDANCVSVRACAPARVPRFASASEPMRSRDRQLRQRGNSECRKKSGRP